VWVHHQHVSDERLQGERPARRQAVGAVEDLQAGVAVKGQAAVGQQAQQAAQRPHVHGEAHVLAGVQVTELQARG
jgi:hypothetical protein